MIGRKSLVVWILVQVLNSGLVSAGPIKRLVMSGKLIEGHAKYEESCNKCHRPFKEDTQKELCLRCHKQISSDIDNIKGFHGRVKIIKNMKCKHCHTDHKGRTADIVLLDLEMFDHTKTDFIIGGGHTKVDCGSCHKKGTKYRNAPLECSGCHAIRDPHRGNIGNTCEDCHSEESWNKTEFNHRNTAFPLKGKHQKLSCSFCHPGKRFNEKVSNSCYACHVVNDNHNGTFGEKCGNCHTEINWKKVHFSHEKLNFRLEDRHSKVACNDCHKEGSDKKKTDSSCFSCHKNDDAHNGVFGQVCDRCHSVAVDWPDYIFNHDKTAFPLQDRHKKVFCDSCHRFPLKPGAEIACIFCHKKNDVHSGIYGEQCDLCHDLKNRWIDPAFDHDSGNFPLKGSHKKLNCRVCHKKIPSEEKHRTRCIDCHSGDDVHKHQEGEFCERCHNEESWTKKLLFDHDLTPFPLVGIHTVTPCEDCHLDSAYKETPRKCYECHPSSEPHQEGLGKECGACHNPNGWRLWTFDHQVQTKFPLKGEHRKIKCVLCHKNKPENKVKVSNACMDCHSEADKHRGEFGTACNKCHTTNSFKELNIRQ